MRAIHGGKVKNDRIDSQKVALLLRGGILPWAYAYPRAMRATRDLLRRRMQLVRSRADITCIPLKASAFAYLALVHDRCSRRVVGWSLAEQMTDTLVVNALQYAIRARQPPADLVHHSDRGSQ